jgi:hypothetical protein
MKCLVKARHDPSRRERCDLWCHALSLCETITPYPNPQPIIPFPTGRIPER